MGSNGPESAVVICVARAGPRVGGGRVCGSTGKERGGTASSTSAEAKAGHQHKARPQKEKDADEKKDSGRDK